MGISIRPVLRRILAATPSNVKPLLWDDFEGTGAITAHLPDISQEGIAWAVPVGTFANLSGGYLGYSSTSYGRAIQNLLTDNFECRFRTKYWQATASQEYGGLVYRCNAAGDNYYTFTLMYDGTGCKITGSGAITPIQFDTTNQPNAYTYKYYGAVSGNYYGFRLLVKDTQVRLYDENDTLLYAAVAAVKTGQYYIGPYTANAVTQQSWDYFRVYPVTTRFRTMSIMGDSISNDASEWPGIVTAKYHGKGLIIPKNHAVAGSTIANQMDGQTDQCEADNPDFTIIALGTNDGGSDRQAEYTENLLELWGTVKNPIYCMGVLPKDPGVADRIAQNGYISAAVASAQGSGVQCYYWNTDGWIDPATDTSDGLHPTAAGELKIANEVLARLP